MAAENSRTWSINGSVQSSMMQLFERARRLLFSRLVMSIGAQALVSGFHFSLNLLLLRLVTPYDYGVFAFAFVLAMFSAAVNNALISTPLTVYTPIIKDESLRSQQESLFSYLNIGLSALLLALGCAYALVAGTDSWISIGVTSFVAIYAARQFSRSKGYARMRPLITATGDTTYVLSGVTLVGLLIYTQSEPNVGHVLLALTAAHLCAMLVEWLALKAPKGPAFSWSLLKKYAEVWIQSRWALAGSVTTLFLAQAHSVIVTGTHGPDAFAPLAAGFVLFGPVRVALLTWQNMVKPELAVALSESRHTAVRRQILLTSGLMCLAVMALGAALYLAWPWVHAFMYAEQYSDQPMGWIVGIWAVITLCAASYNAPSAALQALRDFRILAIASIFGALISGILVALTLWMGEPSTTLYGILAAELFMALFIAKILLRQLRADA